MKTSLFALAIVLATATPALADDLADAPSAADIVVTGVLANDDNPINPVRLPQSARISSQVMTADDVEKRQARDVFDLLNYGTGIFTTTTGKQSPSAINIRGDANFAFIIDGAYVPPQLSARLLQTLPASAIEEVRIVRTSTALTINPLVGIATPSGAANNGFIVVRTKRPKETQAQVGMMAQSFNTFQGSAQGGTTFHAGSAEGYVYALANDYVSEGPEGFNTDKKAQTLGLKAGIDAGRFALDLSFLRAWAGYGLQRGTTKLRPSTSDADWRLKPLNSVIASANGTIRWNSNTTTLLTIAYTEAKATFHSGSFVSATFTDYGQDNSFLNLALRHNLFLGDTKFQAGFDLIHWKNPNGQFYYQNVARDELVRGFFLQADQTLLGGRLVLDLGGRIDKTKIIKGIDYFVVAVQPNLNTVKRLSDVSLPDAKFVSAGASLKVAGDWLANARFGYSAQPARPGTALADPTKPIDGEKRLKFEFGMQGSLLPWLRPSANFFYIKTDNELRSTGSAIANGQQFSTYSTTNTKRTGIEAIVSGEWGAKGREGSYRMSVTHYFSVIDPSGLMTLTQPRTVADLTFDQNYGSWRASLAAKYVSSYTSNSFVRCAAPNLNCTGTPVANVPYLPIGNFVNVDLNLSRGFSFRGSAMRVTASIKNLLDKSYETTVGYPNPGRIVGIDLTAAFH